MKNCFKDLADKDFTISNIINLIQEQIKEWKFADKTGCPWYRGQDGEYPPLPSVFRKKYDEFNLNTTFRNRASALKDMPETNRIDKWLFLIQHYGAPTRLLDWTESLLNALFFALDTHHDLCKCKKEICECKTIKGEKPQNPTIWAIHPYELNKYTNMDFYPNTWTPGNLGCEYFRLGFHPITERATVFRDLSQMKYPIAVNANYLDMRIFSQQSCFTIHGTDDRDFISIFDDTNLVKQGFLQQFIIPAEYAERLYKELISLGMNKTIIYPDLDHFALDMKRRFEGL